jgi:3',5'-cyclic AMP phosphodiesterase CpdA
MRKKLGMTGWYNPVMLVQTGIRVAVSTVFGQFADRREAMAAANAIEPQPINESFIYRTANPGDPFWFDFLADTGDGWDSTFAMAQLLTASEIGPAGAERLPRGRVLLIGGDLVYPTASPEAYDERFLGPFDEAFEQAPEAAKRDMPDLYAIPGNHDWYDGLSAFFDIFCRRRIASKGTIAIERPGRVVAGRQTKQSRSYFAIRLPDNWWVWGTDSQLKGFIDQPQIDYFQHVARHWMPKEAKVILLVGQPSWAYVDPAHPEREFESFSYLERLPGIAREPLTEEEEKQGVDPASKPLKNHQLKLVLTGDSHHYSRYVEGDLHYITCGGGGAFLHPTHQLASKSFTWRYPPPGVAYLRPESPYQRSFAIARKSDGSGEALFPDRATSSSLAWRNWKFAFANPGLTTVFIGAYILFNWLLNTNARIEGYRSLMHALTNNGTGSFLHSLCCYLALSFVSAVPPILFLAALGGYYYFADSPHDTPKRLKIGLFHCLVQAAVAILVTCTTIWSLGNLTLHAPVHPYIATAAPPALLVLASVIAAVVSATVFGLYLAINLNWRGGRHWNEAFSALAVKDFKCFLRMKIQGGKLHIYPVGLLEVPDGGGTTATLNTHLIEPEIAIS